MHTLRQQQHVAVAIVTYGVQFEDMHGIMRIQNVYPVIGRIYLIPGNVHSDVLA